MKRDGFPVTVFAITDHHVILTLNIKEVAFRGDSVNAKTELAPCSDTDYGQCQHESYFKDICFNHDGRLHVRHLSTVFTEFDAAKTRAIKNAQDEIEREESRIARLRSKLELLKSS